MLNVSSEHSLKCNQRCMSVKCEPNKLRVARCDSGNLWIANCKSIINMGVGSCISLYHIKSAFSVYVISSLYVKQSKSNKHIFQLWFSLRATLRFTLIWMGMNWKNVQVSMQIQTNHRRSCWITVLQILENSWENSRGGVLF